jgi:hypothetical protein
MTNKTTVPTATPDSLGRATGEALKVLKKNIQHGPERPANVSNETIPKGGVLPPG